MFDDYDALSFDCYGTLIDWESGIAAVLGPWARGFDPDIGDEDVLVGYATQEARVARQHPTMRYPAVLAEAFRATGREFGFPVTSADAARFGSSVPEWPAFTDSQDALLALSSKYRLIILSNVDRAGFEGSRQRLGMTFDQVITAEDVGTYKPAAQNFLTLADYADRAGLRLLHVAQSLFHDHVPAAAAGLSGVWINRRHDRPGWGATPEPGVPVQPRWEYPSMSAFATAALS